MYTISGQLWLTSWGYQTLLPVDDDKMRALGEEAVAAINKVNGRVYDVEAAGIIFPVAGQAEKTSFFPFFFLKVAFSENRRWCK